MDAASEEKQVTKRLMRLSIASAAVLALAACVTINVYFPAAEIKDLSRKIEDEVQKQAAKEAAPAPDTKPAPEEKPAPGTDPAPAPATPPGKPGTAAATGLLDALLGVTPAYAGSDTVAPADVTSPAIRKIIESRAARAGALREYKNAGAIGENKEALVEVRKLDAVADLKARAEVQRLVKAENADREELFREIAAAKGVDLSQLPKIRETYAATLRDNAKPGDWVQMPDGAWKQK
jgi:uncharacterized protein YdbL (DUF1318 family)